MAALARPGYAQPVWHCSVRTAPEDRVLSDAEWAQIAAGIMNRTGLVPAGDDLGVRWVAVRHAPDHIHIVATLARQDGDRPAVWNDIYRVRDACRDTERRFGLRSTAPADRTAARRATRSETEQAARRRWNEAPRATLRREVCTAAAGARTEQEFFTRLHQAGVLVRKRYSTINPGEVTGYAVGLAQHTASDGEVVWYGGGKLAADLTLPKLRVRWTGQADESLGREVPAPVIRSLLRQRAAALAARAAGETDFFARLRETGLLVQLRLSEINPGQVTGYSVAFPSFSGEDGKPLWFGCGQLAADLTLPQLRAEWARQASGSGWGFWAHRWAGQERDALYGHASSQAATAAEHIRRSAANHPTAAADAAWAAADTFHMTARALMTRRCDAPRTPTTVPPAHDLREAQQHAAQAAAARKATERLHQALAQARTRAAQQRRAARPEYPTQATAAAAYDDLPEPDLLDPAPFGVPSLTHPGSRPYSAPSPYRHSRRGP